MSRIILRLIWVAVIVALVVGMGNFLNGKTDISVGGILGDIKDRVSQSPQQDEPGRTFKPGDISTLKVDNTPDGAEGYDRDEWVHWSQANEWGWNLRFIRGTLDKDTCDARDAALFRDSITVEVDGGCEVIEGRWVDPYDGDRVRDASTLDIDHMVPLAEAYRSGGWKWTAYQREEYANDPAVLLTTGADTNRAKSDQTPDQWAPPAASYHCAYATHWVAVKDKYNLTVTRAEKRALVQMLNTCQS